MTRRMAWFTRTRLGGRSIGEEWPIEERRIEERGADGESHPTERPSECAESGHPVDLKEGQPKRAA